MKTIVLGYDDSEPAQRALERTVELARAFGARVVATSVVTLMPPGPRGGGIDPLDSPSEHREELARAKERLTAAGVEAELVPAVGDPADAIVEVAKEHGADLIVVGSRGLGFLERLLGQSVSESVAHQAPCDVLIVR